MMVALNIAVSQRTSKVQNSQNEAGQLLVRGVLILAIGGVATSMILSAN